MLLRLCQMKSLLSLILLLFVGCSFISTSEDGPESILPIKASWFSSQTNHALVDREGSPVAHLFFDITTNKSELKPLVSTVIITRQGSTYQYEFDLASGQRYFSHAYCPQKDIWNQYSGEINKPNFSTGIIPGFLDQIGSPQKVIVFGGARKFKRATDIFENTVKLVGAYIEQNCPEGNCLGKSIWVSRMVFVAVDLSSKKLKDVNNVASLESLVDWGKAKAVLENQYGYNDVAGARYPYIRVGNLIPLDEAIRYHQKNSIFISTGEARKIQKGCHALYDKLWKEVGEEQDVDKPAFNLEQLNKKAKLIEQLKEQRKPVGFAARFKTFAIKYHSELMTCEKFVYAGNINRNPEEFWFLTYVGTFMHLHNEGYYFDCRNRSWQKNVKDSFGRYKYDFKSGIESCQEREFDQAMTLIPNFLKSLVGSSPTYFKFVDYDNHPFGSHAKLYSLVDVTTKKMGCDSDENIAFRKQLKAMAEDVKWKSRFVKDMGDEMKIIY